MVLIFCFMCFCIVQVFCNEDGLLFIINKREKTGKIKNDCLNLRLWTLGGQGSCLSWLFLQSPGQPGPQQVLSELNAGRQTWERRHLGEKGGSDASQLGSALSGDLGLSLLASQNLFIPHHSEVSASSELDLECWLLPSKICVCHGLCGWSMMLSGEPRRIQEEVMEGR